MYKRKKGVEEVLRELELFYNCDGIQDIVVEKGDKSSGRDVWIVKLYTWDGRMFKLKVVDAEIVEYVSRTRELMEEISKLEDVEDE